MVAFRLLHICHPGTPMTQNPQDSDKIFVQKKKNPFKKIKVQKLHLGLF